MTQIKTLVVLLIGSILLISCEEATYEFGDMKTPTNIQVTATLVEKMQTTQW